MDYLQYVFKGGVMNRLKYIAVILALILALSPVSAFTFAGDEITDNDLPPEVSEEITDQDVSLRANANDSSVSDAEKWTAEDFTYEYYSKLMYGCDYTRQFYVNGQVVTGFSDQGLAKLDPVTETQTVIDEEGNETVQETVIGADGNTDLVIPSRTPDGELVTGVGTSAFNGMFLTSVTFPKGMLVRYDDNVTHSVSRRGNFIIHESAFANNRLTEVTLPTGVLACMANSFQNNQIEKVTFPRTIWWIETLAFANNEINKVNFPQNCDFRMEMHGMTFANNNIKSVRLPDYTEVINKDVFAINPGMEPVTEDILKKRYEKDYERFLPGGSAESGIVYMYTTRSALFDAQRIHTIDRPTKNQYSPFQKLVLISSDNPDTDTEKWNCSDFTYDGTTVTGLSESGKAKRAVYTELEIPDRTPDGRFVSAVASTDNTDGGVFGELVTTDDGTQSVEGFDNLKLPNELATIGDNAFAGLGLKDVSFPQQLRSIGEGAFRSNRLENALMPDSVTEIGNYAFADNSELRQVTIPANDEYSVIGEGTFASEACGDMSGFVSVEIPDNITQISDKAFKGNNFRIIDIPGSVKTIGNEAFASNSYSYDTVSVALHEGLMTLGSKTLANKKIETVVIPETLDSVPQDLFARDSSLVTKLFITSEEQFNDKTRFGDSEWHKAFLTDPYKWTADDFTFDEKEFGTAGILNAVTGFSEQGLDKFSLNTSVKLPATDGNGKKVDAVAPYAFSGGSDDLSEEKSCLYGRSDRITELVIPEDSISYIGEGAFLENEIRTIEFPEGLSVIGVNAFAGGKLVRASFSSTITDIQNSAFSVNDIDSLDFKDGEYALSVAADAFKGNNLKSLQIADNLDSLNSTAFSDNPGMDSDSGVVYIYKPTESGSALEYMDNGLSTCQNIRFGEIPAELAPWGPRHFTFSGDTITGFSEDGELKLASDPYVVLPGRSDNGTVITTVGGVGTVTADEDGNEVTMTTGAFEGYCGNKGVAAEGYKPVLKGVEFASSITMVKMKAFNTCAIEEIELPDSISVIEPSAFASNYGMKKIVLSANMKEIPDGAFVTNATTMDMSTGVHEIIIPDGVTRVGTNAFRGQHVTHLEMPESLTEIGDYAFYNHQITDLDIPSGVKTIGLRAFSVDQEGSVPCPSSLKLHEGLESIGSQAFGQTDLASVELPESLTELAADAFFDKIGKGKPDNTPVDLRTSVKDQAEGKGKYEGIEITGENPKTHEEGGHKVVYDKMVGTGWTYDDFTYSDDGKTITGWTDQGNQKRKLYAAFPAYPPMIMPDKPSYDSDIYITEIGKNAFALELYNETTGEGEATLRKFDCDSPFGIQRLEFPSELEKIGDTAFEYNNLKAVDLASVKKLRSIGMSAFHGNHLVRVEIPDTVDELGGGAFAMNNITALSLSRNVTKIPQGCFSMNIFMSEVEIPDTVTEIDDMAFAGARLETLDIPSSVTRIGRKAFHLHHLKTLHIPGNVKVIDESAFEGTFKQSTLTTLILDEGIEEIGKYAFKEALLEEVFLPESLQRMGVDPFYSNRGKDGSNIVYLYAKTPEQLKFNNDEYHGFVQGVSKHYHKVIYVDKDKEKEYTEEAIKAKAKRTEYRTAVNKAAAAKAAAAKAKAGSAEAVKAAEKALQAAAEAKKKADEALAAAKKAKAAAQASNNQKMIEAANKALKEASENKNKADALVKEAEKALSQAKLNRIKSITSVTVNKKTVNAKAINAAIKKAGGSKKYVKKIVIGKKVRKISKNAFKSYKKVKTIEIKTKKLTKKSVKKSLKGSKVKTVKVKVSKKKSVNKKYVKKYKKFFTKKNAGRKVKIK